MVVDADCEHSYAGAESSTEVSYSSLEGNTLIYDHGTLRFPLLLALQIRGIRSSVFVMKLVGRFLPLLRGKVIGARTPGKEPPMDSSLTSRRLNLFKRVISMFCFYFKASSSPSLPMLAIHTYPSICREPISTKHANGNGTITCIDSHTL